MTRVVIASPDKDLAQCVIEAESRAPGIACAIRSSTTPASSRKFGVTPARIPDYLALVGDSADGIPGVPRWGAKSASSILAHYLHLEAIPSSAQDWAVKVRGAELCRRASRSVARPRYCIVAWRRCGGTSRCDESLDDLAWRGPDADRAAAALSRGWASRACSNDCRPKPDVTS